MNAISQFYSKLRAILGVSYGMIVLFMFLPFMVISCGEGSNYTVLAEQNGTDFLMFELPEGRASEKAQEEKIGIYGMGGMTWTLLLCALVGLGLVIKNAEMKKTGFVLGLIGSIFAFLFMIWLVAADSKMKEDAPMINIEIGSGLTLIFLLYLATGIFAKLQKKPKPFVPKDDIPLDGYDETSTDISSDVNAEDPGDESTGEAS